jgi:hypothetical protein
VSEAERAFREMQWPPPEPQPREVYRTRSGAVITDAMVEGWAAEAEAGYDPDQPRPHVVNVNKLARVVAELVNSGVIDREDIGMQMRGHLNVTDVETWLRS